MVENKIIELIEKMKKACSIIDSATTNIINYKTNVPGYVESIINGVNQHLDIILHEARAMFPLCAEARARYEKINDLYNEMRINIDAASNSIKSKYEEEINKLKSGDEMA